MNQRRKKKTPRTSSHSECENENRGVVSAVARSRVWEGFNFRRRGRRRILPRAAVIFPKRSRRRRIGPRATNRVFIGLCEVKERGGMDQRVKESDLRRQRSRLAAPRRDVCLSGRIWFSLSSACAARRRTCVGFQTLALGIAASPIILPTQPPALIFIFHQYLLYFLLNFLLDR